MPILLKAKGRIERLFKTLQDRLVREMRLKGIKTIKGGNRFLDYYLPIHNKRFSFKPDKQTNLHRNIPQGIDLDRILCIKTNRTLRNDFTIGHNKKLYQIIERVSTKKVIVEERTDGSMSISHNNKNLKYKEITQRPIKPKEPKKTHGLKFRKRCIPLANHPWRNYRFGSQIDYYNHQEKEKEPVLVEV